jgi:hypothetical protein
VALFFCLLQPLLGLARRMLTGDDMETVQSSLPEQASSTGCCPRFDPAPFTDARFEWHDEPFLKEHVVSVLHLPLNMGRRMKRANALIEAASAQADVPLMLSDEASPWGTEFYIRVKKAVPGAQMIMLSGTYLTKVFEGPYRNAPKWQREMERYVEAQGHKVAKIYFAYTTCPACAKAYGKNYVVLFARIDG